MYYTYMLRCADDSIYTGIAADIDRRMAQHFTKSSACARYTRSHGAKKLEIVWHSENRSTASKLEFHIKRLSRVQKESLIKSGSLDILREKIDPEKYTILQGTQ